MKKRLQILLFITLASLVITTPLFWLFERAVNPEQIRNFADALWWWIVTSTTLGYGDIVPVTWPGRIVSVVTIVVGFFIFANMVAIIAESVHAFVERKNFGTAQVKVQNHIVICEYTAIADELIQSLPSSKTLAGMEVAIISDLVSRNPYPQYHYVRGVPINPAALMQANIEHAAYVFIFANLRFSDPDMKTLHIASRVIKLNPHAKICVEMVDPENSLLDHLPQNLFVMQSRDLTAAIVRTDRIDLDKWVGLE